jgi:hypothetical protein
MQLSKEGALKHIILLATVVALTAAMLAASSLSVPAQEDGQYASSTGQTTIVCAPWSKDWDLSQGHWYFDWYRWCVDTSLYNPAYESSWFIEWGSWEWGEQANLCPEKGSCTISPGGGIQMRTTL